MRKASSLRNIPFELHTLQRIEYADIDTGLTERLSVAIRGVDEAIKAR
jgi:hypothetical protein